MSKNFIQGAIKRPGGLHASLGVPQGQKVPPGELQAAAGKPGLVGQQARFAMTLSHLRPKKKRKVRSQPNKGY